MYVPRQPYRQVATPSLSVFTDLLAQVGVLADAEAVRNSLKTPRLVKATPRRTYGVRQGDTGHDEMPELASESEDED